MCCVLDKGTLSPGSTKDHLPRKDRRSVDQNVKNQTEKIRLYHVYWSSTVNSEIFARTIFSRIALKDIFVTLKMRD